jgi:hypothetical protein
MGHCGKFGYAIRATAVNFGYTLWANASNEATHYQTVMISTLWALVQDLGMRYGPQHRAWLCAMAIV